MIRIPVTLDNATRKKDRSVSFRFTSNLELPTDEYMEVDKLMQRAGWLLFAENELEAADVPKEDAAGDEKRPSVRLRGVIWHIWDKNTDRAEPFELFYQRNMDRIIEKLKDQLT